MKTLRCLLSAMKKITLLLYTVAALSLSLLAPKVMSQMVYGTDCVALQAAGKSTGVNYIQPEADGTVYQVYCDVSSPNEESLLATRL